jgi:GNAT superfamily N-acetyltransferase
VDVTAPPALRTQIRPGDIGAIAGLHGHEYSAEYGLDARFEAHVAQGVAAFVLAFTANPEAGRLWLAEDDAGLAGCIAITRSTDTHARLRWFLVARRARGRGLGRRLLDEALAYVGMRFSSVELETFSELRTAASLYRAAGFELRDSAAQAEWGREIELHHYELRLSPPRGFVQ